MEGWSRLGSDRGSVELELPVIVFAVVGGLELVGRSGAFVAVDPAGEFAEIRFALEGPGAVGGLRLHFEWDGIAEAQDAPVIGAVAGDVTLSVGTYDETSQAAIVPVDIADPLTVPGSLDPLCGMFSSLVPISVERGATGLEESQSGERGGENGLGEPCLGRGRCACHGLRMHGPLKAGQCGNGMEAREDCIARRETPSLPEYPRAETQRGGVKRNYFSLCDPSVSLREALSRPPLRDAKLSRMFSRGGVERGRLQGVAEVFGEGVLVRGRRRGIDFGR